MSEGLLERELGNQTNNFCPRLVAGATDQSAGWYAAIKRQRGTGAPVVCLVFQRVLGGVWAFGLVVVVTVVVCVGVIGDDRRGVCVRVCL